MSLHVMPFLILNLGVEMMFILNSRLLAQQVVPARAMVVLSDIGSNMFDGDFVKELFKPQRMYAAASVLQVFTALSSSSVMHLSENSLRKLYDLVYMTVKYQVFTQRHPLELLELTLNHLDSVQDILPALTRPLVREVEERVLQLANTLNVGDWANVRRSLLNFFVDRHVRVSVFLDMKVQDSESGAFRISRDCFLSPSPASKPPGLVYVAGDPQPGKFAHPDAHLSYPPHIPLGSWVPRRGAPRMTNGGFDIYTKVAVGASSKATPAGGAAGGTADSTVDPLGRQTREVRLNQRLAASDAEEVTAQNSVDAQLAPTTVTLEQQRAYDAELKYLAELIGPVSRPDDVQGFELDLFSDFSGSTREAASAMSHSHTAPSATASGYGGKGVAVLPSVPISRMTVASVREENTRLLGIMHDFQLPKDSVDGSGRPAAAAQETGVKTTNSLLDIMDEL